MVLEVDSLCQGLAIKNVQCAHDGMADEDFIELVPLESWNQCHVPGTLDSLSRM